MTERCPNCNLKLIENGYGDLVCANCGIIKQHIEKREEEERPSYLG